LRKSGGDLHGLGCLQSWHVQDLAEHVREAVRPVEALEHAECASNLHLLNKKRPLCVHRPLGRQTLGKVLGELREVQVQTLDRALFTSRT
jgi:hypothetical protein